MFWIPRVFIIIYLYSNPPYYVFFIAAASHVHAKQKIETKMFYGT